MTFELHEAQRRMETERDILSEIKKSKQDEVGLRPENLAELELARRKTVLSIWALRSTINEAQAA